MDMVRKSKTVLSLFPLKFKWFYGERFKEKAALS